MKKLLHERLREAAKNGVTSIETCDENRVISLLKDEELSLAYEIEKYYIPRPRFEDGEPVQFGDRFVNFRGEENSTISSLTYTKGNNDYVNINGWHKQNLNEPVYRYKPKVLDADGVEIKAGQTRWHIPTGKKVTIQDLGINKKTAGDSVGLLGGSWVSPLSLTLKEPDSMEKILVDMMGDNHMRGTSYIRRIQALMERDA